MKERIKLVRKTNKLTQQQFAERLSISASSVASMEYGRRDITDRTIKDICREFQINEDWLRTGEGEMLRSYSRDTQIAELVANMSNTEGSLKTAFCKVICDMDEEQLKICKELIINFADELKKEGLLE